MTPKKMNKVLIGIIVLLLLVVAAGLYFANARLTSTARATAQNKAELEVTAAQISSYKLTQTKVSSLSYVDDLANSVLPANRDESAIVAELSQFALRARLSVAEISFAEATKPTASTSKDKAKTTLPAGVNTIPITVKLKAGARFENLLEFLRAVENNRRTMQVTNISLTPDDEDRSILSDITISINLYTRK